MLIDFEQLRERLAKAGTQYDGHVTNGSLKAQMAVIEEELRANVETPCFESRCHYSG